MQTTPTPAAPGNGAQLSTAAMGNAISRGVATAFGDAVAVLMRHQNYRHAFLCDLEWMVAPGVASGQFAIAHRNDPKTGASAAIGVVLWAMVSEEVNQRLSAANARPKLKPEEWTSGQIPWLVEAAGEPESTRELLKALVGKRFAKAGLRAMQMGADGKLAATVLEAAPETGAVAPAGAVVN